MTESRNNPHFEFINMLIARAIQENLNRDQVERFLFGIKVIVTDAQMEYVQLILEAILDPTLMECPVHDAKVKASWHKNNC